MSIPLPPLNLSLNAASDSKLASGDTFNFAPPQAKTNNVIIYGVGGVVVIAVAFLAFRGR